jgi:5-(carboxyamino)imidazole ribonucleotide mutase
MAGATKEADVWDDDVMRNETLVGSERTARHGETIIAPTAAVGIIMGSVSDWETMEAAADTLERLAVPYERRVVSAHRTPDRLRNYAMTARERGLKVIIAGAGGAAHLPGMTAAWTTLPVLGVPVESRALSGIDSLFSIVQMPHGIPVGTLAIGKAGAINAALLAVSILTLNDRQLLERFELDRAAIAANVPFSPIEDDDGSAN